MNTNGKNKEESKMKKTLMTLCAAVVVLLPSSCSKTIETPQPKKIDITLMASIGNSGTKTEYTDPADGSLSVTWSAEDEMSLLVINGDGEIVSNTVLVNQSGAVKNADFTGTIPLLAAGQKYLCVYPALKGELTDLESDEGWLKYDATKTKLVYNPYNEDYQFYVRERHGTWQKAFKGADLMIGVPEIIDASTADVVLERQIGVLKLVVTVPALFTEVAPDLLGLQKMTKKDFTISLNADLSTDAVSFVAGDTFQGISAAFDSAQDVSSGKMVVYLPLPPCTLTKGTVYLSMASFEHDLFRVAEINSTVDVEIQAGKMTSLTVSSVTDWVDPTAD